MHAAGSQGTNAPARSSTTASRPSPARGHRALALRAARGVEAVQLGGAAQRLRVGRRRAQRAREHVAHRHAAGAVGVQQLGVHAVARGQEAVLGQQLAGADQRRGGEALLELQAGQRLHERAQRGRAPHVDLRVHDAHLDGPEARLRAHVPPQEGRLGERPAAQQHLDGAHPVLVGGEGARQPRARERAEQRRAGAGQAGVAALPERRVGRQRQQQGQVGAQRVEQPDGGLRLGDANVDVQRERRLAPGEAAHRVGDELVAPVGRHLRLAAQRERMHARAGQPQVQRAQLLGEAPAQRRQLGDGLAYRVVRVGGQLDRRAVRLAAQVDGQVARQAGHHVLGAGRRRPAAGVQEHDLLLDADGVGLRRRPGQRSTHVAFAPPF